MYFHWCIRERTRRQLLARESALVRESKWWDGPTNDHPIRMVILDMLIRHTKVFF